jgi:sodium transport system permease protein
MNTILTVFKKEIIDSIRDKRTLWTAVLMPIFLMPAILVGSLKFQEYQLKQTEAKPALVAVQPAGKAPTLVDFLKSQPKFEIQDIIDIPASIDAGTINIALEVPENFESELHANRAAKIQVKQKSSNIDSATALSKVQAALALFNQQRVEVALEQKGINPETLVAIVPTTVDIATAEERGGFIAGFLLPMFIVLFAIVGGMYIAIDVSAGEKERKTLEALVLAPISRLRLVMGKYLAVAATASASIIMSLTSLTIAFNLFPPTFGSEAVSINLTAPTLAIMLVIGVILSVMFAGLLLSVAIFAKSYKEAVNYISPFYLLAILPVAIFAQIPGLKPTLAMFLIPGVNATFVMKDALIGEYDLTKILVTLGSLLVYATIAILAAGKIYSKESILFRD